MPTIVQEEKGIYERLGCILDRLKSDHPGTIVNGSFFLIGSEELHFDDAWINNGYQVIITPKGRLEIQHYIASKKYQDEGVGSYEVIGERFSIRLLIQGSWEIMKDGEKSHTNPDGEPYLMARPLNYGPGIEARLFL